MSALAEYRTAFALSSASEYAGARRRVEARLAVGAVSQAADPSPLFP